ncbi:MAG: hypothetical protein IPL78_32225 [Chloroflexi bacterium]|nr:hypothetical protein [Chloroflexota bacterium]
MAQGRQVGKSGELVGTLGTQGTLATCPFAAHLSTDDQIFLFTGANLVICGLFYSFDRLAVDHGDG